MKKQMSAKFSSWFLLSAVGFLMLFSPFSASAQKTPTKCEWMWKWVQELVSEEYYNWNAGKYESHLVTKTIHKYVYDCAPASSNTSIAGGKIQKVWVDYDVYENQKKGMRIHNAFDVWNLKGKKCSANAYFYFASGKALKDFNNKFGTTDGNVAMHEDFSPIYQNSTFKDFRLFMPYDELHMDMGKFSLKFFVKLSCEGLGFVAQSEDYKFEYTRSK